MINHAPYDVYPEDLAVTISSNGIEVSDNGDKFSVYSNQRPETSVIIGEPFPVHSNMSPPRSTSIGGAYATLGNETENIGTGSDDKIILVKSSLIFSSPEEEINFELETPSLDSFSGKVTYKPK